MLGAADVERLIENALLGGFECGDEGAGDILDMHDRPPGRSVRLEIDEPSGHRPGNQVVEHDIESDPGRKTVCGRWTQEGGTEIIPGEQGDIALRPDLRDAVGRDGVERARFLHELIAGQTVIATRRGKQKALDVGSLGEPRQMQAGAGE